MNTSVHFSFLFRLFALAMHLVIVSCFLLFRCFNRSGLCFFVSHLGSFSDFYLVSVNYSPRRLASLKPSPEDCFQPILFHFIYSF